MLPERLRPILALLSTVPVGTHDSAQNDFVTSLRSVPTELPQVARLRSAAGKGSYPEPCGLLATRAKLLTCPAVNLGPAFALFAKVLYSKNHNMFRTVGFLAMLAAVRPRECCNLKHSPRHTWRNQGPEHEEGGVSSLRPTLFNMGFFAAWLFFCFILILRSSPSTGRSWTNPAGFLESKIVALANIFVRRMLYMLLDHAWMFVFLGGSPGLLLGCDRHPFVSMPNP